MLCSIVQSIFIWQKFCNNFIFLLILQGNVLFVQLKMADGQNFRHLLSKTLSMKKACKLLCLALLCRIVVYELFLTTMFLGQSVDMSG